jgi:hypothetical protein
MEIDRKKEILTEKVILEIPVETGFISSELKTI